MSFSSSTTLPHRSVSGLRAVTLPPVREGSPSSPHTPLRAVATSLGSPSSSSARSEEDTVVIELGCRKLRVGFAGDPLPKRIVSFDPEQTKRPGDFRQWDLGYNEHWRKRASGDAWCRHHELFQLEVRGQDLALIGDRLERGLRDAFTKYLLVDTRPRKLSLILPPDIPLPLLSSVLDTLFVRFQAPTISLFSSPVMSAFAAGVRSGLIVDVGWNETTVTAVYEYREVQTWRTIRAGKMLLEETRNFVMEAMDGRPPTEPTEGDEANLSNDVVSFDECEEIATRMLWCKKVHKKPNKDRTEGLPTLHEQDETETVDPAEDSTPVSIRLESCAPPKTVEIPFSRFSEPCETTFFQTRYSPSCFDDHEIPLHLLVYRGLLQLPMDVRAICMSRIIFTGGCSLIPGLKERIFDEVSLLAQDGGWNPISGKAVEAYKNNPKLQHIGTRKAEYGPRPVVQVFQPPADSIPVATAETVGGEGEESPPINPAEAPRDLDEIEEDYRRRKDYRVPTQGVLRAIDSLGPWCGASLATHLKIPALAMVDRELWLQHGVSGATRPSEIDIQAQTRPQRQSMGPGLMGGRAQSGAPTNWTLGVWGVV